MSLAPRARLGAYEIVALIGAGGMGEVYRAHDTRLGRDVAIKILPEIFANDAERIARFQREAQVLASLSHPHIGAIHGLEEAGNIRALVLELVEGPTLADRIAEGPIPCDEATAIAKQIADAVQAAHDHGVIHRDLKPANVKLKDGVTVKVLDFGLAKPGSVRLQADLSASPTITSPAMMSGAGVILGTAAYMSPEQAKGKVLDKRTDIWAFGCILFEMLAGARAFSGEDVSDTMAAILRAEPDWNLLPKDLPEQMRLLIRRCLEKNRDKRIGDLGVASFLMTETLPAAAPPAAMTPASVPTRSWMQRLVPIAAVAVVAAIVGAASIWLLRPTSPPMVARFSHRLPEGQQFTNTGRRAVAISPDGTRVAYTANNRIYVKAMWDAEARPLPGTDIPQGVMVPTFSPDGRSIAFWVAADGMLKKVLIDGGAPVPLCAVESAPVGLDWSGDTLIFGQAGKGIMRVSENGGSPELIAAVTTGELPVAAQILPDGRRFMYILAKPNESETGQVVVQTLGSSERKIVMHAGGFPRYLPTGHLLYHSRGVLLAVPFDVDTLEIRGGPVAVIEGVRRGADGIGVAHFAISANGSLAYIPGPVSAASTPHLDVAWLDQKGSVESLRLPPRAYEVPRVSPNGQYLAVGTDDGKEADILVYDLSGSSSIRRLTFGGRNHFPVWSSDTTRVTFESDREGDRGIYWQRADGTGPAERLTKAAKDEIHVPYSWSATGDTLLFASQRGPNQTLMTFSVRDNKTAPFGDVRSSAPVPINATFSPDGRWIAYARNEGNRQALYVQPFPATGARYEIDAGRNAMWSPDGKTLYFGTGPAPVFLAVKINTVPSFSFSAPTTLPRPAALLRQYAARNYDISRDGTRFAIVVGAAGADPTATNEPRLQIVLNWFEELKQRVPTKN